jgi:hypothetical protein
MTNTLSIYRSTRKGPANDPSNGGISSKFDEVILVTGEDINPAAPENAVVLVKREFGDRTIFHLEPVHVPEGVVGPIAGGTFAATYGTIPGLPYEFYGALALHDRFETPEEYARYSN